MKDAASAGAPCSKMWNKERTGERPDGSGSCGKLDSA